MTKNKLTALIVCCMMTFTLFSCSFEKDDGTIYFPDKNQKNYVADGEITHVGENLNEMMDDSHDVVIGEIINHGDIDPKYYYFSVFAELKITEVIKGDHKAGDCITVVETGERGKDGEPDESLAGVPLLQKKMKVLLFLDAPKPLYEGSEKMIQSACGSYYGKFFFDNDGKIHPSTEFSNEKSPISDFNTVMTEQQALGKLETASKEVQKKSNLNSDDITDRAK